MSANRIKITLGTPSSKKAKVTWKTPICLRPEHLDKAVDELSQYLHLLADDKERLMKLLESFAEDSWEEYMEWYNDFHGL